MTNGREVSPQRSDNGNSNRSKSGCFSLPCRERLVCTVSLYRKLGVLATSEMSRLSVKEELSQKSGLSLRRYERENPRLSPSFANPFNASDPSGNIERQGTPLAGIAPVGLPTNAKSLERGIISHFAWFAIANLCAPLWFVLDDAPADAPTKPCFRCRLPGHQKAAFCKTNERTVPRDRIWANSVRQFFAHDRTHLERMREDHELELETTHEQHRKEIANIKRKHVVEKRSLEDSQPERLQNAQNFGK